MIKQIVDDYGEAWRQVNVNTAQRLFGQGVGVIVAKRLTDPFTGGKCIYMRDDTGLISLVTKTCQFANDIGVGPAWARKISFFVRVSDAE